jgi:hypothetical protein
LGPLANVRAILIAYALSCLAREQTGRTRKWQPTLIAAERWGRHSKARQESLQVGQQVGNVAAYVAVEGIWDNGWRDFSPSEVRRMYADIGVKGHESESIWKAEENEKAIDAALA